MEPTYPLDTLALIFGDGPETPTADVNSLYHASVNLSQDYAAGLLDADYSDGVRRILAASRWRDDPEWQQQCSAWRAAYLPDQQELWWWPSRW
ncbi:MAG: hypothetical protein P3W97_005030 [Tepidimonas sp.]|uniref:hypothetical protein n=1 Tax=Tepidimonas sp. TaxID=2002775 RepID=UPI00259D4834|nr:hypothetical protein [Tepidimonas sp.]MDM7456616.1 hypothetical protein [Tepidimonas sp.]